MTAPTDFDLRDARPEFVPADEIGVPNHRASSGENGEPPRVLSFPDGGEKKTRPGIFGNKSSGASSRMAKSKKERATPPRLTANHRQSLEDFYTFIGTTIRPFDELTGDTIIEQAPACAKSVYNLAQENDAVRRAILAFTTVSTSGAVIMAHLPIILALMRHSRNQNVKMMAAGTMVSLKIANQQEAEAMFADKEETPADA